MFVELKNGPRSGIGVASLVQSTKLTTDLPISFSDEDFASMFSSTVVSSTYARIWGILKSHKTYEVRRYICYACREVIN